MSYRAASAVTSASRPSAHPGPAPPGQSKFEAAVNEARLARAAAEGKDPSTHGYETAVAVRPGQCLALIATAGDVSLPILEADNRQIGNPNQILPGEIVFIPGKIPVSQTALADIQRAERADEAAAASPTASRKQAAQAAWSTVRTDIANDLRTQGAGKIAPDQVVEPTLTALDNWAIGNDDLKSAAQAAYGQIDAEWQDQGLTSEQVAPILKDRAAAIEADQALHGPNRVQNCRLVSELQQQSTQEWSQVQQDIQQWLTQYAGGTAFPEDKAAKMVSALDASFAGDTRLAAAGQAALQAATQDWRALGVTHDKLDPVINAYNSYESALNGQRSVHNAGLRSELAPDVSLDYSNLVKAIETHVSAAAGAGSSQARQNAILQSEALLELVGPQTTDFENAVDTADTDLLVTRPAEQVAEAYQRGGAPAAAQTLLDVTKVGGIVYAARIIAANQPTIDEISADLGTMANAANPQPIRGSVISAQDQFAAIYDDLSAAVEQADHGAAPNALGGNTAAAADLVASSLAAHAPRPVPDGHPEAFYAGAAESSIGNGQGATLSLALASALAHQGRGEAASAIVSTTAVGYDNLKTRVDGDVRSFAQLTQNLEQLRASWAPFMTPAQLSAATAGYARHNPRFVQQFAPALAIVRADGRAIVAAQQAFGSYAPRLSGIASHADLRAASANLTGSDTSALFAVGQSGVATIDAARQVGRQSASTGSGGGFTLVPSDFLPFSKSARTFANQSLKRANALAQQQAERAGERPRSLPFSDEISLGLSAAGLFFSTQSLVAAASSPGAQNISQAADDFYNGLGFAKYSAELASRSAKLGWIKLLGASQNSALATLTKTTPWEAFSSFYYLVGAFAGGVSAYEAASSGDPILAGGDAAVAAGSVALALNAAPSAVGKGLLGAILPSATEDATINAVLDWAGPIGAGVALTAQFFLLAYGAYKQKQAQNHLQDQGRQFLQDGLGLSSPIASALADVSHNQHQGPAAVLSAYAKLPPLASGVADVI
jgi:hypothetical protein